MQLVVWDIAGGCALARYSCGGGRRAWSVAFSSRKFSGLPTHGVTVVYTPLRRKRMLLRGEGEKKKRKSSSIDEEFVDATATTSTTTTSSSNNNNNNNNNNSAMVHVSSTALTPDTLPLAGWACEETVLSVPSHNKLICGMKAVRVQRHRRRGLDDNNNDEQALSEEEEEEEEEYRIVTVSDDRTVRIGRLLMRRRGGSKRRRKKSESGTADGENICSSSSSSSSSISSTLSWGVPVYGATDVLKAVCICPLLPREQSTQQGQSKQSQQLLQQQQVESSHVVFCAGGREHLLAYGLTKSLEGPGGGIINRGDIGGRVYTKTGKWWKNKQKCQEEREEILDVRIMSISAQGPFLLYDDDDDKSVLDDDNNENKDGDDNYMKCYHVVATGSSSGKVSVFLYSVQNAAFEGIAENQKEHKSPILSLASFCSPSSNGRGEARRLLFSSSSKSSSSSSCYFASGDTQGRLVVWKLSRQHQQQQQQSAFSSCDTATTTTPPPSSPFSYKLEPILRQDSLHQSGVNSIAAISFLQPSACAATMTASGDGMEDSDIDDDHSNDAYNKCRSYSWDTIVTTGGDDQALSVLHLRFAEDQQRVVSTTTQATTIYDNHPTQKVEKISVLTISSAHTSALKAVDIIRTTTTTTADSNQYKAEDTTTSIFEIFSTGYDQRLKRWKVSLVSRLKNKKKKETLSKMADYRPQLEIKCTYKSFTDVPDTSCLSIVRFNCGGGGGKQEDEGKRLRHLLPQTADKDAGNGKSSAMTVIVAAGHGLQAHIVNEDVSMKE
eukprot:jgi/Bigna1/78728/fgenesh1_pg.56_\